MQKIHIGFLGAGGIARAHAYSIQSLKYYYDDVPELIMESVASATAGEPGKFCGKIWF